MGESERGVRRAWGQVRRLPLLCALAGVAVLAGCGSDDSTDSAASNEPVQVGVNVPRSGPVAFLGDLAVRGVTLAVDEINAGGGIESLGGRKLKLVIADNQGKPDLAMSEQQRLAGTDGIVATIGSMSSATTLSATQAAERAKHPIVVPISTADEITERGFDWTFRVSANSSAYGEALVDFVARLRDEENIPIESIAILHEDSEYGESIAQPAENAAKEKGFTVKGRLAYPAATTDVNSLLTRVRQMKPDVVLQLGYIADSALIWNTRRQMGLDELPFISVTSGVGPPEFLKAVRGAAEGTFTLSAFSPHTPEAAQEVVKASLAKYDVPLENNAAHAYQAMWALKGALEDAGSTEAEAVRKALDELVLEEHVILPQERLEFDDKGQNHADLIMLQIVDDELVPVAPAEWATEKPDLSQFDRLRK